MTNTIYTPETQQTQQTQQTQPRKLRRSLSDKMLAGVCSGWARFLGVDAAILRILLVAATIFGFGTGILLYLACWILMPPEGSE